MGILLQIFIESITEDTQYKKKNRPKKRKNTSNKKIIHKRKKFHYFKHQELYKKYTKIV